MSPGGGSVRVRRRPLAPGPTQRGMRATRGPRGQGAGGRVVVTATMLWGYWGKCGGTRGKMVRVMGDAWLYRG